MILMFRIHDDENFKKQHFLEHGTILHGAGEKEFDPKDLTPEERALVLKANPELNQNFNLYLPRFNKAKDEYYDDHWVGWINPDTMTVGEILLEWDKEYRIAKVEADKKYNASG